MHFYMTKFYVLCKDLSHNTNWEFVQIVTDAAMIKRNMLRRMGEIAYRKNLALAIWEDGLMEKGQNIPIHKADVFPEGMDVFATVWQTVWEWGGGSRPYNLANVDYKVSSQSMQKINTL